MQAGLGFEKIENWSKKSNLRVCVAWLTVGIRPHRPIISKILL